MSRPARPRRGARIPRRASQRVKCRAVMDGSPLTFRSEPCEAVDPLQVFAAAGAAPRFYWEQPAAGRFRVGVGCAARLTVRGHERFERRRRTRRQDFRQDQVGRPGTADCPPAGRLCLRAGTVGQRAVAGICGRRTALAGTPRRARARPCIRDARSEPLGRPRPRPLASTSRCVAWSRSATGTGPYVARAERILDGIRAGDLQKVVLTARTHHRRCADRRSRPAVALRERYPNSTLFAVVKAIPCSSARARNAAPCRGRRRVDRGTGGNRAVRRFTRGRSRARRGAARQQQERCRIRDRRE